MALTEKKTPCILNIHGHPIPLHNFPALTITVPLGIHIGSTTAEYKVGPTDKDTVANIFDPPEPNSKVGHDPNPHKGTTT